MPVRSAQVVRVPVYIRSALRTTRPTSFGSGYAGLGTDAPCLDQGAWQVGLVVLNAPRGTAGVQHGKDPRPTNVLAPAC